MRFWLKAIAEFFEQLFSHTEADDLEGSLGTSPAAPAAPAGWQRAAGAILDAAPSVFNEQFSPLILPTRRERLADLKAHLDFAGPQDKPISQAARRRICKAFQQYADEHIK